MEIGGPSTGSNPNEEGERVVVADVICEFLETCFNLILYVRSIYPDGIFRKAQKYNISVMMSCHPELNKYLSDILTGINSLIKAGNVERVTLQINTKEEEALERYVFELRLFETLRKEVSLRNGVNEIKQHLRNLLLKINTCDALLQPLPDGCSFAVSVQTKESVANELLNCDHFEGFPWVTADEIADNVSNGKPSIVPLKSCITELFQLQCFVEKMDGFSDKTTKCLT